MENEKQSLWYLKVWKNVLRPFLRFWDSSEPQREGLAANGEIVEQWQSFSGAGWPTKMSTRTHQLLFH